jgi:uncharacterized membrane protein YdjX (TVP38/TMEM64 family)
MNKKNLVAILFLVFAIAVVIYFQAWQYIKPDLIKSYIEGYGVWMPIIYCFLYLIAVFIPYAGTAMTVVGGLLFNPFWGTLLVITISSLFSILPFLIAKKYGREYIKDRIEKTKYEKYLHRTNKNSFMFALYMRLIPIIPYELQNYILGLIDISTKKFFIATFIGLLPGTFFLIYLGNTLVNVSMSKIIVLAIISLFAVLLPIFLKRFTRAKEVLEIK